MFDFLFHSANVPFSAALGLMAALSLLETVATLLGVGFSGFFDSQVLETELAVNAAADAQIDGAAAASQSGELKTGVEGLDITEAGASHILTRLLAWFHVGRVPVLILLVLFLFGFGVLGLVIQSTAMKLLGVFLPRLLVSVPAFAGAAGLVRLSGKTLAALIPKDETDAVSEEDFIGRVAQITLGAARRGSPAQAKVYDARGRAHYVMIEPDDDHVAFAAGAEVLLVRRTGAVFVAIPNVHKVLTRSS